MSNMTQKMTKAASSGATMGREAVPRKGDHFRCQKCGMALEITTECKCDDPDHVRFECCGQDMAQEK